MLFRLNPECYYVPGHTNGAIYDLIEGDIYALNQNESDVIKKCENCEPVEDSNPFLLDLKRRCIGNFYKSDVYIEKLRLGSPIQDYQRGRPPFIARAFLEINNTCENSCWYCGYHGIHRSLGCMGCNIWNETGKEICISQWKRIIDELKDLKCNSLIFTGGDLTSDWEKTRDLVTYSSGSFRDIHIILNESKCLPSVLDDLGINVHLILQTTDPAKIRSDHTFLMSATEGMHHPEQPNVAVEIIARDFSLLQPDNPVVSRKKVKRVDLFRFCHNKKSHPCLGNSLTITWKGDIIPCPLLRRHSVGNILKRPLYTFLDENGGGLAKYWNLRLETLGKCSECEFRYACTDCRPLEESLTGSLRAKQLCNYDPHAGTWI